MSDLLIIFLLLLGLYALIIWILTVPASLQRINKALKNKQDASSEILGLIFAPLFFTITLFVELAHWIMRKLSFVLLILLFPLWLLLFLLYLLVSLYPIILDAIIKRFGQAGEKILTYNEELPRRVIQRSKESWNTFLGNFTLLLDRTPLKRLLAYQETIQAFSRLGLQDKALAVLRAQALDPRRDTSTRLRAVQSLCRQGRVDELLNLLRDRHVPADVAHDVVNWLERQQRQAELIQAYNLLGLHHEPDMQLDAARHFIQLNRLSHARVILFRLIRNPDPYIRIKSAEIFGELGAFATALPILTHYLQTGQDEAVRLVAAESLYRLNRSEDALKAIFHCLNPNLDSEIHRQAIQTLGRLQLKRELILVKANRYLKEEDWRAAVYALETLGDESTAFVCWLSLGRNLKASPALRKEALENLARLGEGRMDELGSEAFQRIRDILWQIGNQADNPADLRLQAAQTLRSLGWQNDASALFLILSNRKNQDAQVQSQAAQALRQFRRRESPSSP